MDNEDTNKNPTEQEGKEISKEAEATVQTPKSKIDEAREIAERIEKATQALKAENDRMETLKSEELLSGTSGGQVKAEPKEVSPQDYVKNIMEGNVNDVKEE